MQRFKCDMSRTMQQFASTVFLRRSYMSRTRNLYEVLGLNRAATQGDIKTAYYKLSKVFHPDHNKDTEAAEKFREITAAYEVLGNFRLRKLYDKGIIHTAGEKHAQKAPTPEEDENDPTTRFYKARLKKEHTGRAPIYDFDTWTEQHYGGEFHKQKKLKEEKTRRATMKATTKRESQLELLLIPIMLLFCLFTVIRSSSHDVDRIKSKKSNDDTR